MKRKAVGYKTGHAGGRASQRIAADMEQMSGGRVKNPLF